MRRSQPLDPHTEKPIIHRAPRYVWIVTFVLFLFVLGFTILSFVLDSGGWYQASFMLLSTLFVYSFVELATRKVTLTSEHLIIVSGCRRRIFGRSEVESVTWAKGVGVSVKLVDSNWIHLPEVGGGSQGLANSVRAWIKRTKEASPTFSA